MQSFKLLGSIGLATLFAAYGCSVEVSDTTTATSGAGGAGGAGSSTVVGPGPTTAVGPTSSSSSGMVMDESSACENAVELAAGTNMSSGVKYFAAEAVLATEGDKDYFKFTAKKGDFINIGTEGGGDGDPAIIDPVVTLYSADGKTKFAEVDDSFPRVDTNSNFDFRVPADGTYCLEVQEFSTWKNSDPKKGDDTLAYAMVVVPYDAENLKVLKGLELDKEPNDDTAAPQTMSNLNVLKSGQIADFPFGTLDPKTDKDVYKFTTPKGAVAISMNFEPSGVSGNGSTGDIGLVNIWSGDAKTLIAQLDYNDATAQLESGGSYGFSSVPAMEKTDYLFEIKRKDGADLSANPFYFFKAFTSDAVNPQEVDNTKNATAAGAESTMAQQNQNDPKFTNRFIGGSIPAGDVDYWKFDAAANDKIIVVCSSRRAGSGVEDLKVDLLDSTEKSLQSETETSKADLVWSTGETASKPPVTAKAGTYYLKLSSTKMIAGGATSSHYLCGVHTQAP